MAGPAPVLRVKGVVNSTRDRSVPESPARDAVRDPDTGALVSPAYEYRPGYEVVDVTILTDGGGFIDVVFRDVAMVDAGGWCPKEGDTVDIPVRAFDAWRGTGQRRFRTNGYSFAGAVYAAEQSKSSGGARALASTGS